MVHSQRLTPHQRHPIGHICLLPECSIFLGLILTLIGLVASIVCLQMYSIQSKMLIVSPLILAGGLILLGRGIFAKLREMARSDKPICVCCVTGDEVEEAQRRDNALLRNIYLGSNADSRTPSIITGNMPPYVSISPPTYEEATSVRSSALVHDPHRGPSTNQDTISSRGTNASALAPLPASSLYKFRSGGMMGSALTSPSFGSDGGSSQLPPPVTFPVMSQSTLLSTPSSEFPSAFSLPADARTDSRTGLPTRSRHERYYDNSWSRRGQMTASEPQITAERSVKPN